MSSMSIGAILTRKEREGEPRDDKTWVKDVPYDGGKMLRITTAMEGKSAARDGMRVGCVCGGYSREVYRVHNDDKKQQ